MHATTPYMTCAILWASEPENIDGYRTTLAQLPAGSPAIVTTTDGRRVQLTDDYTGIAATARHALALLAEPGPMPPHLGRGYRSHHYHGFPIEHLRRQAARSRALAGETADLTRDQLADVLLCTAPLDGWAVAIALGLAATAPFSAGNPLAILAAAIDDHLAPADEHRLENLTSLGLRREDAVQARHWVETAARHAGAERIAYAHLH